MLDNLIIFKNYSDLNFNFDNNLKIKDSLLFKNCSNFNIIINNKINKISLINCNNFKLVFTDTISGIDIEKSNEIKIKRNILQNNNSTYISCFLSSININYQDKSELKNIDINNENSNITFN